LTEEGTIMSNVSVVYATKTRHSGKLAEQIAKEFGITAKDVEKYPEPEDADLLFLVGGIYAGKSHPALLSYAEKLDASVTKKVVLVTSSVSVSHRSQKDIRELLIKKGIAVVDEITCTGAFLFIKLTHPDKTDIQNVVEKAKDILKKTRA
jgi:flavodoxin